MPEAPVSVGLRSFLHKWSSDSHNKWDIRVFECGGGGDCLFHAIREGLHVLRESYTEKYEFLFREYKEHITTAKGLRRLAANTLVAQGHEDFLNKVIDFKNDERTAEWHDSWSPRLALLTSNLAILEDESVTRVNAIQYDCDMISIDREST